MAALTTTGGPGLAPVLPLRRPTPDDRADAVVVVVDFTPRGRVRRRRLVAASAVASAIVGLVGLAHTPDRAAPPVTAPPAATAVVAPGETLWDVAVRTSPAGADPRAQLDALQAANGLDGGAVAPWTVLLLPGG